MQGKDMLVIKTVRFLRIENVFFDAPLFDFQQTI